MENKNKAFVDFVGIKSADLEDELLVLCQKASNVRCKIAK